MAEIRVSEKFPELFHYTAIGAFESIVRSRQFWATHCSDMNDSSEHNRFSLKATAFIRPLVARKFQERMEHETDFAGRVAHSGGLDTVVDREAEMHIRKIHQSIFGRLLGPFIVSFCNHNPSSHEASHGLLSQWRGYGAGGGVAIVLSTPGIERLMQQEASIYAHTFNHIGNARYDDDDKAIRDDFKTFFELAPIVIEAFYGNTQPPYEDILSPYVRGTTLVKHHAFHEETEVRIVVCPRSTDIDSVFYDLEHEGKPTRLLKYRSRDHNELRYLELFGSQLLPIERVIIGPSRIQRANKQRVEEILSGTKIPVTMSDIPFLG